jgi:hypothetical protein
LEVKPTVKRLFPGFQPQRPAERARGVLPHEFRHPQITEPFKSLFIFPPGIRFSHPLRERFLKAFDIIWPITFAAKPPGFEPSFPKNFFSLSVTFLF